MLRSLRPFDGGFGERLALGDSFCVGDIHLVVAFERGHVVPGSGDKLTDNFSLVGADQTEHAATLTSAFDLHLARSDVRQPAKSSGPLN